MTRQYRKIKLNLEILAKGQDRPRTGDVFVFKPQERDFYFGLVVDSSTKLMDYLGNVSKDDDWDVVLVYVYNLYSPRKELIPALDVNRLLLPPLLLDVNCWQRGIVESVAHVDLSSVQLVKQHCFKSLALIPGQPDQYIDEHGKLLEQCVEPCGVYGMTPFRGFDDKISRALKIPLAPD